jgi:hypothetical protein
MRPFKTILYLQAGYIMITAVWPVIDIESFMLVTGPKTDIWLVKTVSALLIPVSLSLFSFAYLELDAVPAYILGGLTSIAFIVVDFYYALNDTISDVYLLDGILEVIFLLCWIYLFLTRYKRKGAADSPH